MPLLSRLEGYPFELRKREKNERSRLLLFHYLVAADEIAEPFGGDNHLCAALFANVNFPFFGRHFALLLEKQAQSGSYRGSEEDCEENI